MTIELNSGTSCCDSSIQVEKDQTSGSCTCVLETKRDVKICAILRSSKALESYISTKLGGGVFDVD